MGSPVAHRRIRFLLLIAILIVCGMTVSSFLARQRLRRAARPLPPKIAGDVDQQTQTFSMSKTLGGQALYKIEASQVTNFKDTGKTILHNVSIEIYGKKGDRQDHISSEECEFDAATGSLFIPGKVDMALQAPAAEPDPARTAQPSGLIQVVTSALSFNQNTGMATTDKEVQFRFDGGEGSSQGAIYDPQERSITLKAQARFKLWRTQPDAARSATTERPGEDGVTYVEAGSLRFQHGDRKISLGAPVQIAEGTRQLQAGDSEIFLDEQQRAQKASLHGGVHGADRNPARLSQTEANHGDIDFTNQGKVRHLVLEGDADSLSRWATASAQSVKFGQARRVEMFFDETSGQLARVTADEQVRVVLSPGGDGTPAPSLGRGRSPVPTLPSLREDATPGLGTHILSAQHAEMYLAPDGETLREVKTRASSTIQLFPAKAGEEKRTIQGDTFHMQFGPDGELAEFTADQKVRLVAEGTGKVARNRTSASDHLWASFDSHTHSVSQMRQWGNFAYREPERQARAERADYSADGDVFVLQGEPLVWNPTGKLAARKITLVNSTSDVTAEKQVSTTYFPSRTPGSQPPEPVHVTAERMQYNSKTEKAVYRGNARIWQGSSLIEAGVLELDRQRQTLTARESVYSIFPGRSESQNGKPRPAGRAAASPDFGSGPVEIRSNSLIYKDQEQRAQYQGEVRMQNVSATLTSRELEILFEEPAKLRPGASTTPSLPVSGGSWQVERAVATGDVVIVQPGRKATGTGAEYFPRENKIILIGNLAAISDAQKGLTQGTRLTYFTGDDRILVQGEPGSPAETRRQVQR